jgi:hypothetical protein
LSGNIAMVTLLLSFLNSSSGTRSTQSYFKAIK